MEGNSMLCQVFASSYKNGEMILPPEFCRKFPNEIPETAYLGVRNGEAWRAYYSEQSACIVNLGTMMSFYKIEPYNVILLRYKGDGNFNMEIFSGNVEISYPLRIFGAKKPRLALATGSTTKASRGTFSDLEMEKMAARFLYNAFGNSRMSYDLTIEAQHLEISNSIEKFNVAILENSEVNNVNEEGKGNCGFYFKSFKILTEDMLDGGDQELP